MGFCSSDAGMKECIDDMMNKDKEKANEVQNALETTVADVKSVINNANGISMSYKYLIRYIIHLITETADSFR